MSLVSVATWLKPVVSMDRSGSGGDSPKRRTRGAPGPDLRLEDCRGWTNAATDHLPFHDRQDFEDAGRGFLGSLDPCVVTDACGRVVWDNDAYGFLQGDCPDSGPPEPVASGPARLAVTFSSRRATGSTRSGASTCRT